MADTKDKILYQHWKEIKHLRDRKLHYFVTHYLYPFSPYYRRLFDENKIKPDDIRTVDDLGRVPFTSKKDFFDLSAENPASRNLDFILQPNKRLIRKYLPRQELLKISISSLLRGKDYVKTRLERQYRPVFLTATAGTTEQPVSFLYTNYDIENLKIYGKRIIDIIGIKPDQRAINVFPYAPHLAFWQTVFAGISSNVFILSTGGGKTLGTGGNIKSILKVKPQFLIGVGSYIYHILKTAQKENHRLDFLNNVILGAARIPQGFKKKISDLLEEMGASHVKVFGTYGFTESRCAWAECPTGIDTSSGYHSYPDMGVFEIVDPDTGEVKAEGEDGEIVYTNIDARGSCVFRYRTGDLARGGIVYSPCPHCRRTVPRISSDIVRASNVKEVQLSKIKGSLVNLNALERLLDDKAEIDDWQIEIVKKDNDAYEVDEMVLYLSLLKDLNKGEFTTRLNQEVFSATEVSFNRINFVSKEEISRRIEIESAIKAKRIVDRRSDV